MQAILPANLSSFDYLLKFPEGLIFRSEILITYCTFKVFPNCSSLQFQCSPLELSTFKKDTFQQYVPNDHFDEIPNLIVSELASFSDLRLDSFEQEDCLEYLLRGICQLALKYVKGVEWYSEYI